MTVALAALVVSVSAPPASAAPLPRAAGPLAEEGYPPGRPTVKLDHLELPEELPDRSYYRKQLERILRREVRRAKWGAGSDDVIVYRFRLEHVKLIAREDALSVECSALGRLPKGKRARSQLRFSGDPKSPKELVVKVLEIVARGVVTRLAALERKRRGYD